MSWLFQASKTFSCPLTVDHRGSNYDGVTVAHLGGYMHYLDVEGSHLKMINRFEAIDKIDTGNKN